MTGRLPPLLLAAVLAAAAPACGQAPPADAAAAGGHAVVLLYHHVADDTPPSTSVTPDVFDAHLDYLDSNGYQVIALSRLIDALADGGNAQSLPEKAVAITFDDAYASVYHQAAARLEQHGYPYAVFVSTDYIDQGLGNYMTWQQLRDLETRGAEIANHSRDHGHYVHRPTGESRAEWRARIKADIESAQQRLEDELHAPLEVIAYPYGEFNPALQTLTRELGMVGFGQQSGPVGSASDLQALPRFPMAAGFAELDSLAEKLRTRPFQVTVLSDDDPVLAHDAPAPTLRVKLKADTARLEALSCFVTGQDAPQLEWVDADAGILEVTARRPLPAGRSKYTCTAPSTEGSGIFHWYSHLWMKPPGPGSWYSD
ncbi:MAG: polysaccharide deacetylase family protein [Gammaproteobacteria bacterium]|nr:polysaccharide deacetylase family protein [Gammaproteobacteria bacterium]